MQPPHVCALKRHDRPHGPSDQFLVSHAQVSFYDVDIVIIGSSNMDLRAFTLNMVESLAVVDTRFVAELQRVEAGYLRNATPLRLDEWKERPQSSRLFGNLARLTAALQ